MIAANLANMEQGHRSDKEPSANLQKVSVSQSDAAKLPHDGDRAIAAGKYKVIAAEEAKQRQVENLKKGNEIPVVAHVPPRAGKARDIAGKKFGLSGKTVDRAARAGANPNRETFHTF